MNDALQSVGSVPRSEKQMYVRLFYCREQEGSVKTKEGFVEEKEGDVKMKKGKGMRFFVGVLLVTFLFLNLSSSACADMSITEANRPYSVPFQDWVYIYLNNEFVQAAPTAPDYTISMRPKIIDNRVRFVITGYYFNTKLGMDWYRRYASQLDSIIAMMCHSWTQRGHQINPDDFEINIRKEELQISK